MNTKESTASVEEFEVQLRDAMRDVFLEAVEEHGLKIEAIDALIRHAGNFGEQLVESNLQAGPPPSPIQCNKGCSWCCWQRHIEVTPPEAFLLVSWLKQPGQEAALDRALSRLSGENDPTAERAPCPLLDEEGACSAYEVRPLLCRGHTSIDLEPCKEMATGDEATHVPAYRPAQRIYNVIQLGWILAMRRLGRPLTKLTLRRALKLFLENPESFEAWKLDPDSVAPAAFKDADTPLD